MRTTITACFILFSLYIQAQHIEGTVIDSKTNEPIIGATIKLVNKNIGTTTDADGHFELQGSGSIEVSFIGYETISISTPKEYQKIRLTPSTIGLQTVEVIGRASKHYNSRYTFSASKIAAKNSEIPQSVSTVTKELILDRQAFRLGDVLKNVSGVSTVSFYNHFAIRGVTQNSGDRENRLVNGMRTSQIYFNQPLSSNVERVEVIKGPSSMTFSNTDAGGSINIVTKKPLLQKRKQISLSVGSFNTVRGALDFTGPANKDKTLLYRLNIGYENARSFRDLQYKKAFLIAPTFTYIYNDKTRINLELTLNKDNSRINRGQPIFGAVAGITNLDSTPLSFAIGAPNDYYKTEDATIMLNVSHSFTKNFSLNASYMKQGWQEDLFEHRTSNKYAVDTDNNAIPNLVNMQVYQRQQTWYTDNFNVFFNYKFEKGEFKNNTVLGYDHIRFEKVRGSAVNKGRGLLSADENSVIESYDPASPALYSYETYSEIKAPKPNVPYFDLTNPQYHIRNIDDYILTHSEFTPSYYHTNGIYLMNELRYWKLILNLGLRQEFYLDKLNYKLANEESVEQEALLPRIGLTYSMLKNVNLYGIYTESYQPQSPGSLTSANAGGPFDPLKSRMYEFGSKTTWLNGTLQVNVAYFDIEQKNILINANDPENLELLRQRGKESYKGAELEVVGQVLPNLQINIAYAYTDARILEDNKALEGLRKENTPEHNASFWGRYNFNIHSLRHLGLGFGMNYVDEKLPWYTRDFMIPSYWIADAALYYTVKNMKVALNVNNLFDQKYWLGAINYTRLYPAPPRNTMLKVTYNF